MKTGFPVPKRLVTAVAPLAALLAQCSAITGGGLGGSDLHALHAVAQGRYDAIGTVNLVLDRLIAQPAPAGLTPTERRAWNDQTAWLQRTRTHLGSFATGLKRLLDKPLPTGLDMTSAAAAVQLAADYKKLGDDFQALVTEIDAERRADEQRIAAVSGGERQESPADSVRGDTTGRGGGEIVYSHPMKQRHDNAVNALSSLT